MLFEEQKEEIEERMKVLHQQQEEKIEIFSQKQREMEKQLLKNNQQTSSTRKRPNLGNYT